MSHLIPVQFEHLGSLDGSANFLASCKIFKSEHSLTLRVDLIS